MKPFLKYIAYTENSGVAYINLATSLECEVLSTEELEKNDDIIINLEEESLMLDIELKGETAAKIASLTASPKYGKLVSKDGSISYLLKLSDQETKKEI